MTSIDALFGAYQSFVRLPWQERLSGAEKLWMAVYDPPQERRLRFRLPEFAIATRDARHGWTEVDLTDCFAAWMAAHPYREEYFEDPELLETDLPRFADHVVGQVTDVLDGPDVDGNTVVATYGLGSLFGLMRASSLLERVAPHVRGRIPRPVDALGNQLPNQGPLALPVESRRHRAGARTPRAPLRGVGPAGSGGSVRVALPDGATKTSG